ncbi:hypothetical protein HI914_01834 [Erysiphe necator]|nr:hypothetical protein HI914_01834 [Erysiphe necator]
MLTRVNARTSRDFLRDRGIWVRNERTYFIAQSLHDCSQSEFNVMRKIMYPITKPEDLKIMTNIPNPTYCSQKQTHSDPHKAIYLLGNLYYCQLNASMAEI